MTVPYTGTLADGLAGATDKRIFCNAILDSNLMAILPRQDRDKRNGKLKEVRFDGFAVPQMGSNAFEICKELVDRCATTCCV